MKLVKKILLIGLIFFSLTGIIAAIDEFAGGYDEIPATVNRTWKDQKRFSRHNKYTIVWNDLEGESHEDGSFVNKYGYEEGDEIVIKVDKKTHEYRYAPVSHLVMSLILLLVSMLLFIR